jgi:hypothetical protein
MMPLNPILIV